MKDRYISQGSFIVYAGLFALGLLLIAVAWKVQGTIWESLALNVGSGLFGGIITFFLIEHVYQARLEAMAEVDKRRERMREALMEAGPLFERIEKVLPIFLNNELPEHIHLLAEGLTEALLQLRNFQERAHDFLELFKNGQNRGLLNARKDIRWIKDATEEWLQKIDQYNFLINYAFAFHWALRDPIARLASTGAERTIYDQVRLYHVAVPLWYRDRYIQSAEQVLASDASEELKRQAREILAIMHNAEHEN